MLAKIVGWLVGGGIDSIVSNIAKYQIEREKAASDAERLKYNYLIKAEEARLARLQSDNSNAVTRWIRPLSFAPFMIYNAKIVLWDKVLGFGTTDPLSPELFHIQMIMIGFYFGGRTLEKVVERLRK